MFFFDIRIQTCSHMLSSEVNLMRDESKENQKKLKINHVKAEGSSLACCYCVNHRQIHTISANH